MTISIPEGGYDSIFDDIVVKAFKKSIDTNNDGILSVAELNNPSIRFDHDNNSETRNIDITAFEAARLLRDYGNALDNNKSSLDDASSDFLYSYVNNDLGDMNLSIEEIELDLIDAYNFAQDNYVLAYHDYSIFDLVDYFEPGTYTQLLQKANALIDNSSDFAILNNLGSDIFDDGIVTRAEYNVLVEDGGIGFTESSGLG